MGLYKTSGIVIKQVNYGEADKILTILTRNYGKIQAIAKGARKTKNRFLACTQLFCYSDFIYYQGRNMAHINQCELRESFFKLRMNLEKLTYSSYVIELINAATQENEKEEKLFLLLIHTLNYLANNSQIDADLIVLTFQIKLMALTGYAPHLTDCVSCGKELQGNFRMSNKLGGLICPNCMKMDPYAMTITKEGQEILFFGLHQPLSKLAQLQKSKNTIQQLQRIMNHYVSTYLEKTFNSLDFLNTINSREYIPKKGDDISG